MFLDLFQKLRSVTVPKLQDPKNRIKKTDIHVSILGAKLGGQAFVDGLGQSHDFGHGFGHGLGHACPTNSDSELKFLNLTLKLFSFAFELFLIACVKFLSFFRYSFFRKIDFCNLKP